ncbi:hypothetical protein JOH51_006136 [Rhizobium leguminosarum]|nr:hypothetical protein [Rhizobium leguminosarum]
MSQPFGSSLAIAAGAGFVIGGIVTVVKGITRKFERYVKIPDSRGIVTLICVYGLVARGVVFAITGIFFAYAGFGWVHSKQAAWATPLNGSVSFRSDPSSTLLLPLDWQPSEYTILSRHATRHLRPITGRRKAFNLAGGPLMPLSQVEAAFIRGLPSDTGFSSVCCGFCKDDWHFNDAYMISLGPLWHPPRTFGRCHVHCAFMYRRPA